MSSDIRIKRVYEPCSADDGCRVLVDRLWPRGLKKSDVQIDVWLKDVSPSGELRRWFGHRPERWEAFQRDYRQELRANEAVERLRQIARAGRLTLLYAARDDAHNHAIVLAEHLRKMTAA